MKTRVKHCAVWLGLLFGSALGAAAVPVTFQVDLAAQTALGNFNPATDTVLVSGQFNSWATDFTLAAGPVNTDIYQGTTDVSGTVGSSIQYKFIMSTAGGLVWEGNVGPGGADGNRSFTLAGSDQTLPLVFFNNVTNTTTVTTPVTFQVDMGVQTALGNFDPASGSVVVAGDFNSWSTSTSPLTNSVTETNLWRGTFSLSGAVNSTFNYKIVMNGGVWENNGVGPNGAQNRTLTLTSSSPLEIAIYFNNLTNVPVPIPITFQVNMAVQAALGNFNPANGDTVEARGSFNAWAAGFTLTNSPANSNVYLGTFVDSADGPGTSIQYQYVVNGATWETVVGNRSFSVASTNLQTVPLVFFNGVDNLGPLIMSSISGGQATLSWNANPNVRLQNAISLAGDAWQDVPNTAGLSSNTVPIGPGRTFFRLKAP